MEIKPAVRTWWIAYDDAGKVCHRGYTDPGQVTTTGQKHMRTFLSEAAWLAELTRRHKKHFTEPSEDANEGDLHIIGGKVRRYKKEEAK